MSSLDYLHAEVKCMSVQQHNDMQFLLSTMKPDHPNHVDIHRVPGRIMTETLITKFSTDIIPLVQNGELDYKEGLKFINTDQSERPSVSRKTTQS